MHVSQRLRGWLRAALFLDLVDSGPPTPPTRKKPLDLIETSVTTRDDRS
jgi:hypothetical protein